MARWLPLVLVGAAACYTPPSPACGFICGDGNTCPESYTCNPDDRICHLDGTTDTCEPAPPEPGLPVTATVMPSDGATDVPTNATLTVDFSASFDPANTPIDNDTLQVFTPTGEPVAGFASPGAVDSQIVFVPNHLPNATTVTARLAPGIETTDGRTIGGRVWSFRTENDMTPPTMTGSFPSDGSTDFPQIGLSIKLTFSEDVVNAATGGLMVTSNKGPIVGSWFYDPTGPSHVATFVPMDVIPGLATITITNGLSLTDYAGNPVEPFSISMTTVADTTPPTVVDHMPLDGDTNVPVTSTIVISFSERVTNVDTTRFHVDHGGTPITGSVASINNNLEFEFTPDAVLPAAAVITVTLDASIADTSGNQLGTPVTFSFTTQ